jgi:hypothetical protein
LVFLLGIPFSNQPHFNRLLALFGDIVKYLICFIVLALSFRGFAGYRIWTDTQDNVVEAEFVCLSGGKVVLKNRAGKEFKMVPELLSSEDQAYIEARIPPELDVDVTKSTGNTKKGSITTDYVSCTATIRKVDTRPYSGELTAQLLIIAKDERKGDFVVVEREQRIFIFNKTKNNTIEVVSKKVSFRRASNGGQSYEGYLVTVQDRHGKIIAIKSNRATLLSKADSLLESKDINNGKER